MSDLDPSEASVDVGAELNKLATQTISILIGRCKFQGLRHDDLDYILKLLREAQNDHPNH